MAFESTSGLGNFNHYGPRPIVDRPGALNTDGAVREVRMKITGADLADAPVFADLAGAATIPAGAYVKSATFIVTTAFAGATATLDIGFSYNNSGAIANLDDDGIDAAIAVTAIDAAGDVITCDGALVGTVLAATADEYAIVPSYDTAAFTAGEGELVVEYILPAASA